MKAFVLGSYGSSDHLDLTAVDTPVPAADEVLVRVRATSVNPYDWHHMRGEPRIARVMPGTLGLRAPKLRILGRRRGRARRRRGAARGRSRRRAGH